MFDPSRKPRRIMIALFWLCLLALLYFFSDQIIGHQLNPNAKLITRTGSGFKEIQLERNISQAYITPGKINHYPVLFLVDTGASYVSLSENLAKKIGLKPLQEAEALTANGRVKVYDTVIDRLEIGPIILLSVKATISPSMGETEEVLLGMSALKQLEFLNHDGKLIIRQKQ